MAEQKTKLEDFIRKEKLTEQEAINVLRSRLSLNVSTSKPVRFDGDDILFGVISDTHIGHKCYEPAAMDLASKEFKDVDFVIHGGDIIEGHYEAKRPGHVFECTHIGADAQVQYAIDELKKLQKPLFFIEGNHMANTIYKHSGFDVGLAIEKGVPNSKYLGIQHGLITLKHNKKIQLIHPDGGSSYAISYKSQKIVESLEGGTKPDFLSIAHFHKSEYLFYRNVHVIQNGTLERQTPFMRNNGISAALGFWKVRLKVGSNGIQQIQPTYYPFY